LAILGLCGSAAHVTGSIRYRGEELLGATPARLAALRGRRIAMVFQEPQSALNPYLSIAAQLSEGARHHLKLTRRAALSRAAELLELVQISAPGARLRQFPHELSGGMRQRVTIAMALMCEPEILLLDEPTTGLDPQARHVVWDRLFRLKQQGVTLVLTTHYMDEAEQLCDRLVVMDKAKIAAEGTPRELIAKYSTREVLELRFAADETPNMDGRLDGIADRIEVLPDRVLLYTADGEEAAEAVHRRGLRPESSLVRRGTLEDVFLRLTGRSLVD
jgi:lipooligosaccharide transport system ATP-binding protein